VGGLGLGGGGVVVLGVWEMKNGLLISDPRGEPQDVFLNTLLTPASVTVRSPPLFRSHVGLVAWKVLSPGTPTSSIFLQ